MNVGTVKVSAAHGGDVKNWLINAKESNSIRCEGNESFVVATRQLRFVFDPCRTKHRDK